MRKDERKGEKRTDPAVRLIICKKEQKKTFSTLLARSKFCLQSTVKSSEYCGSVC